MDDAQSPPAASPSILGLQVLRLLEDGPRDLSTLTRALFPDGFDTVQRGFLYPVLGELQEAHWAVVEWGSGEVGLGRAVYVMTDAGRQALAAQPANDTATDAPGAPGAPARTAASVTSLARSPWWAQFLYAVRFDRGSGPAKVRAILEVEERCRATGTGPREALGSPYDHAANLDLPPLPTSMRALELFWVWSGFAGLTATTIATLARVNGVDAGLTVGLTLMIFLVAGWSLLTLGRPRWYVRAFSSRPVASLAVSGGVFLVATLAVVTQREPVGAHPWQAVMALGVVLLLAQAAAALQLRREVEAQAEDVGVDLEWARKSPLHKRVVSYPWLWVHPVAAVLFSAVGIAVS